MSPPDSASARKAIRLASSSNSDSTNHGAIEFQSCTSNTSAANSAFSIGPRARRAWTCTVGCFRPRSARRTRSPTGSPTLVATCPAYSLRTLACRVLVDNRHRLLGQAGPVLWRVQCAAVDDSLQPEPEERQGPIDRCCQGAGSTGSALRDPWPFGKAGHADLHLILLFPLVEPLRGALPGGVGVERQHDPAAKRFSSRTCSSVSAVPHVATARRTPADGTRSRRCSPRTR